MYTPQAGELEGLTAASKAESVPVPAHLARMEQHMRERKLQAATLTERLARVDDQVLGAFFKYSAILLCSSCTVILLAESAPLWGTKDALAAGSVWQSFLWTGAMFTAGDASRLSTGFQLLGVLAVRGTSRVLTWVLAGWWQSAARGVSRVLAGVLTRYQQGAE